MSSSVHGEFRLIHANELRPSKTRRCGKNGGLSLLGRTNRLPVLVLDTGQFIVSIFTTEFHFALPGADSAPDLISLATALRLTESDVFRMATDHLIKMRVFAQRNPSAGR